jgi:hypothetical protein
MPKSTFMIYNFYRALFDVWFVELASCQPQCVFPK